MARGFRGGLSAPLQALRSGACYDRRMEAVGSASARAIQTHAETLVVRHSATTRITHWLTVLAFVVLVTSGLQIFNAAPYLDASDKSNPQHRILEIGSATVNSRPVGVITLFGHTFSAGNVLGYTDDGMGGVTDRAFPAWITLPGYQDLADGRRWHIFFAWVLVVCGIAYFIAGFRRKDLQSLILRRADLPKLVPMQLYYLRLRKEPPAYGRYNPLQKRRIRSCCSYSRRSSF